MPSYKPPIAKSEGVYDDLRFRDDGPASSSARATGDHLQKLEEELKQRMDQVVKEVGPDNDSSSVRSELMNFYRSYVEEFTTRTASQP